tara:strand:- start:92 stop:790 length:699 start_codon:yes stop_codon:yes gene_type:complete
MAKKNKNGQFEKLKIQWDGSITTPEVSNTFPLKSLKNIPKSVDLGTWNGYLPCWYKGNKEGGMFNVNNCPQPEDMYFEDLDISFFDINGFCQPGRGSGTINVCDIVGWISTGRTDVSNYVAAIILGNIPQPPNAPKSEYEGLSNYTWGDISFLIEINDGIGKTGSRRAKEARLNQFEQEKKERLVRLICRVKGEKVYDEKKVMGDTYIKLEDAELVINEVLGKIKVENINVL